MLHTSDLSREIQISGEMLSLNKPRPVPQGQQSLWSIIDLQFPLV
jgi:hypothetical protein